MVSKAKQSSTRTKLVAERSSLVQTHKCEALSLKQELLLRNRSLLGAQNAARHHDQQAQYHAEQARRNQQVATSREEQLEKNQLILQKLTEQRDRERSQFVVDTNRLTRIAQDRKADLMLAQEELRVQTFQKRIWICAAVLGLLIDYLPGIFRAGKYLASLV